MATGFRTLSPAKKTLKPMTKRVGIIQSCYIPWKGYFDFINSVDHFVLYDDVQYTRRDWRNRNQIKCAEGLRWLTVPVEVKGKFTQAIRDTRIAERTWAESHLKALVHTYARAPFFDDYRDFLRDAYAEAGSLERLSQVNFLFIQRLCQVLGIKTPLTWSSEFELRGNKSERLLNICLDLGASEYVSGPAARCYLDTALFNEKGVDVSFFDYGGYPEYEQLYPPFAHTVTLIDLLVHTGPEARRYMKSFQDVAVNA